MFNLTAGARPVLDRYLAEVRSALRHCPAVDAADVERDVAEHIELALDGRPTPVDAWELRRVLDELGSPTRWVPPEELGPFRRALLNLRSGPDDLRLGYIAFGLLAGTLLVAAVLVPRHGRVETLPTLAVGLGASFVFARAALAIMPEVGRAERWLLYPPILAVVVPATVLAILWPVPLAVLAELILREPGAPPWVRAHIHLFATGAIGGVALGLVGSAWWGLLAFVAWRWPAAVRNGYRPFLAGFRRHSAFLILALVGWIVSVGALAIAAKMVGPLTIR